MSALEVNVAMVFAAGLGTRMRPITDTLPKPLVAIAGRTMLDHMLDRLAEAGIGRAVVNVHHLADRVEAHLACRHGPPSVTLSDERERLLDQGGGIVKALPLLGPNPFLICNTDALWIEEGDSGVARMLEAWDPARMDVLLMVADTAGAVGVDWPGDFAMSPDGRLVRRREGEITPFVYAGVGLMKPEAFAGITKPVFRLAPFFFEAAEHGRLYGSLLKGKWLHVGTPAAIGDAEAAVAASAPEHGIASLRSDAGEDA